MRRTSALVLIALAVLGAGIGFGVDHLLTISGRATFSPSVMLPVLLLLIAAACLALAWPVRRSVRGQGKGRIDPFRALRAATLARASSLVGALVAGFGAGLVLFLLSRPVGAPVGSIVGLVFLVASALVMVAAALIAEQFCTLPKDPDDRQSSDTAPGADAEP